MRRTLVIALAILALGSRPALAWDPFEGEDFDPGPVAPADPQPTFDVPDGIYLVTEVYTGEVVTTTGDTTTYGTTTAQETPGTYARVVDVVGTGADSAFDGTSFNGRATLPDGRAVGGTYYEDFVLTSGGFVSVNIVFFQDDSLTLATTPPVVTPPVGSPPAVTNAPGPSAPPASDGSAAVSPPGGVIPTDNAPTLVPVVPADDDFRDWVLPRKGSAVVTLTPLGSGLASIDVLRGRSVRVWLRASVDGTYVPVRSWRLVSGHVDIAPALSGRGSDAFSATWLTLAPANTQWTLRFEVTSDAVPGQVLIATLLVYVRSPALVE